MRGGLLRSAVLGLTATALLASACGSSSTGGGGGGGGGTLHATAVGHDQCRAPSTTGSTGAVDRLAVQGAPCSEAQFVAPDALNEGGNGTEFTDLGGYLCKSYGTDTSGDDPLFGKNTAYLFNCKSGDKQIAFAMGSRAGYGAAYPKPSPSPSPSPSPAPGAPPGALQPTQPGYGQCSYVAFADGYAAAQIAKQGTDCATAQDLTQGADGKGPGNDFTRNLFTCTAYGENTSGDNGNFGANPYWSYTCKNASGAQVAFTFGKHA